VEALSKGFTFDTKGHALDRQRLAPVRRAAAGDGEGDPQEEVAAERPGQALLQVGPAEGEAGQVLGVAADRVRRI
jgi:hypothetical protein